MNNKLMEESSVLGVPSGEIPKLCTARQIAELLNVSGKTVYYWVARKEIPFIRVGRHVRFSATDVYHFFISKTKEERFPCLMDPVQVKNRELSRSLKIRQDAFAETKGVSNGNT